VAKASLNTNNSNNSGNATGNITRDIVAKLWNLCNILRDDGITYNEYVTELTYLLFLKMLAETGKESRLPENYRWQDLDNREGLEQLEFYKQLLLDLGSLRSCTIQEKGLQKEQKCEKKGVVVN
jgi:type I restriction-modification system DNA methylase subunit